MRIILIVLATRTNRLHNMVSRIDMNQNGKCCTHSLLLSSTSLARSLWLWLLIPSSGFNKLRDYLCVQHAKARP